MKELSKQLAIERIFSFKTPYSHLPNKKHVRLPAQVRVVCKASKAIKLDLQVYQMYQ